MEDNYTKIPNELIEKLARYRISGEENLVLWAIIRKTYGWNKQKDKISLSQLSQITEIKRPIVARAIKKLISKSVIKKDNTYINEYNVNEHYEEWISVIKKDTGVSKKILGGIKNDNKTGIKNDTYKRKKETNTKEKGGINPPEDISPSVKSSKKKFTDEERLKIIDILDLIKKNLNPSLTVGDFKQWGAIKGIKIRYGEDYDLIYKTVEYCIRNKNEKYFPRVLNGFDLFDKYQKIIDYSTRPI